MSVVPSSAALEPLLGVVRAVLGADAAIAFRWVDGRTAVVDAGWPAAEPAGAPRHVALARDAVEAAGGVLLETAVPRRLVSSALHHALPAPPLAAAVIAAPGGEPPGPGVACGVLVVWHAAPPDADAVASLHGRAPALRAAVGTALGQRAAAAAYDRLAGRFEAVMATVPQAVVFVDDAGSGLVNAAAGRLLDVPAGALGAAVLAERMVALRARATNAAELDHAARRLVADPDARLEHWLWRFGAPDGRTLRVASVPVRDGVARGRLWTFDDVTRETAAEAALERERAFLATVLDSLNEHVSVCAPDGRLTLLNRAAREVHGLDADPSLAPADWSARYAMLLPDGETPMPTAQLPHVRVLETRDDALGVEFVVRAAGRDARAFVANARALRDPSGAFLGSVCAARDTTAELAAGRQLRESEARLSLIYDSVSDIMFLVAIERDPGGAVAGYRCASVNAAYLALTGRAAGELVGRTMEAILPAATAAQVLGHFADAIATGEVVRYEEDLDVPTGRVTIEVALTPVLDDEGRCTHLLGAARDVSARRRAERALRESEAAARLNEARYRTALDAMLDAFYVLRPVGGAAGGVAEDFAVVEANAAAAALVGTALDDLIGLRVGDLVPATRTSGLFDIYRRVLATGERYDGEYQARDPRHGGAWLRLQVVRTVEGIAVTSRDITDRKRAESALRELAIRDELTGLLNRRGFRQLAEQQLRIARREGRRDAVVALDLNGFKAINDTHGHAAGDDALRAVADVLRGTLRETDVIARFGGDEFVVYAPARQGSAGEGGTMRARLQSALAAANAAAAAAGRPFAIETGIGIADVDGADDLDTVLTRADAALYAAKSGRAARR